MLEGLFNFANLSNHLILIGIYCILALSLNLINGSLGIFSLGHNGFWGMGAYVAATVVWTFGSPEGSLLMFAASFVAAMAAAALFGVLVGAPCLRLRGDYLAIATLGFAEIFIVIVRNSESWRWFGERGLGGSAGFALGSGHRGGNDVIYTLVGSNNARQAVYLVLTWFFVGLTYVLIRRIINSGHGRAIQAIRDDETAAELIGVNLIRYKVLVFVIGAALAGLAGALSANYRSSVSPAQFVMMEGIKILLMVVLGGLGSMSGAIVAVITMYASEQALSTIDLRFPFLAYSGGQFALVYKPLRDLWQVLFAFILIVMMLRWPRGLTRGRELSLGFFENWIDERRAGIKLYLRHPLPLILAVVQWGQLLWLLPASEKLVSQTGARVGLIAASLLVFGVLQFVRGRYWRRHERELFLPGAVHA